MNGQSKQFFFMFFAFILETLTVLLVRLLCCVTCTSCPEFVVSHCAVGPSENGKVGAGL